jgi:aryl-alcohol dehydrogenase-like predicted oxidoreductase
MLLLLLQSDLLPVCRELGIGVLAYSPLGRGLLTGQLKDTSKLDPTDFRVTASPWFEQENLQKVCYKRLFVIIVSGVCKFML